MKKIFATMMLAAVAMTGCIKGNSGLSEEYKRVQGGIKIYNSVMGMQNVAALPGDLGLRLAILLAEADKRMAAERAEGAITAEYLKGLSVKISGLTNEVKLQELLFGPKATLEKLDDGWKISFGDKSLRPDGFALSGSLKVLTGTHDQLIETTMQEPWKVLMLDDFAVATISSYGALAAEFEMGTSNPETPNVDMTLLNYNGDFSYTVSAKGMRINFKSEQIKSDWNSMLTVTPGSGNGSLAFSDTEGDGETMKDFKVSGNAQGDSFYATASQLNPLRFSYRLTDGKYRRIIRTGGTNSEGGVSSQIVGGTQECSITSPAGDYDVSIYPSPSVEYVWSLKGNFLGVEVRYNGFVYTQG